MLAALAPRTLRLGAVAMGRRGFCAPAATVSPVVEDIRTAISDMKAKLEAKPVAGERYAADEFESALKAGTVDMSLLSSTLGDFDVTARKLALKCVSDSMAMTKEKAAEQDIMANYDWSAWEKKGLDAATIAEVKAVMSAGVAAEAALVPDLMKDNGINEMEKEITEAFKGPGGFMESASAEEKAAKAAMLAALVSLEKLEVDAVGLRDVTIAEILEREPELRAEVEEEIANNNWGY